MTLSALLVAAESGDVAALTRLVARGADVNMTGAGGERPLHYAAGFGQLGALWALVKLGAELEAKMLGATALHVAAQEGQVEALKVLAELGADKEAKNRQGATPLHLAAQEGGVEAVQVLVELGADIGARRDDGWTPLELSHHYGCREAAQVLGKLQRTDFKVEVTRLAAAAVSGAIEMVLYLWCRVFFFCGRLVGDILSLVKWCFGQVVLEARRLGTIHQAERARQEEEEEEKRIKAAAAQTKVLSHPALAHA